MLSSLLLEIASVMVVCCLFATSPLAVDAKAPTATTMASTVTLPTSSAVPFAPNIFHYSATESNNTKNMNKQIEVVPPNNTREQDEQNFKAATAATATAARPAQDLYLDKHNVVATTPKIAISTKSPSRYEQGLEDYEEAVARVDKIKEDQEHVVSNGWSNMLAIINFLHNAWNRSPQETRNFKSNEHQRTADKTNDNSTAVAEARYIKGDPLKGYYDFVITEGSYKFWAAFQLFTAGLMIYSTLAAIYYSKVNPVVGDYDYTSYLGGRSMADDPEPLVSTSTLGNLANSQWFESAGHSFQFILDAIEKLPET